MKQIKLYKSNFFQIILIILSILVYHNIRADTISKKIKEILKETKFHGGLFVHIGCKDGKDTELLKKNDQVIVHGLDRDINKIETARKNMANKNKHGVITFNQWDGKRLLYLSNLVNLIVAEDVGSVSEEELLRVLVPNGSVYIKKNNTWKKITKKRPNKTDDWTHYLYNSQGNAVSQDTAVDNPFFLQWHAKPKWARSHDRLTSTPAMVSGGGKLFYVLDEGVTADIIFPSRWKLVAKDAYNGITLWKKDITKYESHLRAFRSGPNQLARRLVCNDDVVFNTINIGEPISMIDGDTGKIIKVLKGTEYTEEILYKDGILYIVIDASDLRDQDDISRYVKAITTKDSRNARKAAKSRYRGYYQKAIAAVDPESGKILWKKEDKETAGIIPATFIAGPKNVYYQNDNVITALNKKTGKVEWKQERPKVRKRDSYNAPVLLVYKDVVLSADRKGDDSADAEMQPWRYSAKFSKVKGILIAYSAETGKKLWSTDAQEAFCSAQDVFVIKDLVYVGQTEARMKEDFTRAYDIHIGEVKKTLDTKSAFTKTHHHRCYRNKATLNYIIVGRTGISYLDINGGDHFQNAWTRGACQYGIMPANGLIYAPPHACGCYIQVKMSGFQVYAPDSYKPLLKKNKILNPLIKGRLYGKVKLDKKISAQNDWPTYRGSALRESSSKSDISSLNIKWKKKMAGEITSPVYAGTKVYFAEKDMCILHALSGTDGKLKWSFTADGIIDSPPTIYKGLALFGTKSGNVYCLNAGTGEKVWQFRAEKSDLKQLYDGRIESLWPVHGNVLVNDDKVYFSAGRSSYVDDGIYLYILDVLSGAMLMEKRLYNRDETTGKQPKVKGHEFPGGLSDILSFDGENIFMRHLRFSKTGELLDPDVNHVYTAAGYLDGSWAYRTYWLYGNEMGSEFGGWLKSTRTRQSARIFVHNKDTLFGFGRKNYFNDFAYAQGAGELGQHDIYRLFAADKEIKKGKVKSIDSNKRGKKKKGKEPKGSDGSDGNINYKWQKDIPFYVRAMALADDKLIISGPKHILTADNITDPKTLAEQADIFTGKKGALLWTVSSINGEKIKEMKLPSSPVFDGLIAADNRVYISTVDNTIFCIGN